MMPDDPPNIRITNERPMVRRMTAPLRQASQRYRTLTPHDELS